MKRAAAVNEQVGIQAAKQMNWKRKQLRVQEEEEEEEEKTTNENRDNDAEEYQCIIIKSAQLNRKKVRVCS